MRKSNHTPNLFCFIVTILLLVSTSSYGAVKTWVGSATGGSWFTSSNWSPASSPSSSDDIVINAGTNAMSFSGMSSHTISSLTINGSSGSVTWSSGASTLTVDGAIISQVNVTSGAISLTTKGLGGSIAAGKTFTISSGKSFSISNSSGTGFDVPNTAILTILGSSLQTSTSISNGLTVSGTLNWNRNTSVTIYPMTINSTGVFNLQGSGQKSFSTGSATQIYGKLSMQGTTYGGTSGKLPEYYSGSTLEYVQTSAQNVGKEWPTGTSNLPPLIIINTASGVSLTTGSNRTVPAGGVLNIMAGKLTISTGDLTLENTATVTQATPANNYIVTSTSNGKVEREFSNNSAQTFTWPIGNATKYRPVDIVISGNTSTRTIGISTSSPGGEPNSWYACAAGCSNTDYTKCSWYMSHSGLGSFSYQFTLNYQASDFVGSTPSNMKVSRTNNGSWTAFPSTYNALPYLQMNAAVSQGLNTISGTTWMGRSCDAPPSISINPTGSTSFCPGGSVLLTASGADTYTWSPTSGLSSSTVSNPTASPTSTQSYTVNGTLTSSGCSSSASILVTVLPLPSIGTTASPSDSICPGDSVTLSGTGASSYSWTGGVNNGVPFVPGSTTSYIVTGTAANSCSDTASITVTVTPPSIPITNFTFPSAVCENSANISPVLPGGFTSGGTWSAIPSGLIIDSTTGIITPIGSVTAAYTVTYNVLASACVLGGGASQSFTINAMPLVGVTDSSGTLKATQASATYQWLDCNNAFAIIPGETNQSFTATVDGDYAVAITLNGCTDTSACTNVTLLGIEAFSNSGDIQIFPNPSNGNFTVKLQSVGGVIIVRNIFGQEIIRTRVTSKITHLRLNENGVYVVSVITKQGPVHRKIVVGR